MYTLRQKIRLIGQSFSFHFRCAQIVANEKHLEPQKNIPTLFVPSRYGDEVYQIVKPFIDPSYLVLHAADLQKSCDSRGISMNINEVIDVAQKWKNISENYKNQYKRFGELLRLLSQLDSKDSEYQNVLQEKESIHPVVFSLRKELHQLDDSAMPMFQKIPNRLHPSTPIEADAYKVICSPKECSFDVKSHIDICNHLKCLEFSTFSDNGYFLLGMLANLEQVAIDYFSEQLQLSDFVPLSSVDFCKSFVLEACEKDSYDPDDAVTIDFKSRDRGQNLHLVGSASFEALCTYFVNMNFNIRSLPMKYYSIGRVYDASRKHHKNSLFSVMQSTEVHSVLISDSSRVDDCFDKLKTVISSCYSLLGLPFRTVEKSAKNLELIESRRTNFELWSPAQKEYIPCGYVAQCEDFVSKRLKMTYGQHFAIEGYLSMVHGTVINFPVLLGCIVENLQNGNGTFDIPNVLKKNDFLVFD